MGAASAGPPLLPWPHSACIWRDELDVREGQLEKIQTQFSRTTSALDDTQRALEQQRAKHEETKQRHKAAESAFREAEMEREHWQQQCSEVLQAHAELQSAEAASGAALTTTSL